MSRKRALTPAWRRYMLDAARGLSAYQSAHRRGVSVITVRKERAKAIAALGGDNIVNAVVLALKYGEIDLDQIEGDS